MELSEVHTEHEHATTSLKVVLLIFAIVLIGALAYLVWATNTTPETTDNSDVVKTTTTIDTSNWKVYSSSAFGFSAKYPPTWETRESVNGTTFALKETPVSGLGVYTNNNDLIATTDILITSATSNVGGHEATVQTYRDKDAAGVGQADLDTILITANPGNKDFFLTYGVSDPDLKTIKSIIKTIAFTN